MGKSKKDKKPKVASEPSGLKKPTIVSNPQSYYNKNPAWRFTKVEMCEPFGWHTLDAVNLNMVRDKLVSFESMTWREILIDGKKQNHNVEIDQLCKQAQDRLSELELDDLDQLTSLRLGSTERIWGIIDDGVMNLLWWDSDHQVCPSTKKNT